MAEIKQMQSWKEFKEDFNTKLVYTEKDMQEALEKQTKSFVVNRVIQSFTGKVGPTESVSMQILHIHRTPEGIIVIVR